MFPHWLPLIYLFSALGSGELRCGTFVELVVRAGDNVTLHCDCTSENSWDIHWVRSCTPLVQPMVISSYESLITPVPGFSVKWNDVNNSTDLIIRNITESDLGLYYCAKVKSKICERDGRLNQDDVYHICNKSTKLSYEDPSPAVSETLVIADRQLCDCRQCWLVVQTVCPVCTILFSLLSAMCVFCFCRKTVLMESDNDPRKPTTRQENSGEQKSLEQQSTTPFRMMKDNQ